MIKVGKNKINFQELFDKFIQNIDYNYSFYDDYDDSKYYIELFKKFNKEKKSDKLSENELHYPSNDYDHLDNMMDEDKIICIYDINNKEHRFSNLNELDNFMTLYDVYISQEEVENCRNCFSIVGKVVPVGTTNMLFVSNSTCGLMSKLIKKGFKWTE